MTTDRLRYTHLTMTAETPAEDDPHRRLLYEVLMQAVESVKRGVIRSGGPRLQGRRPKQSAQKRTYYRKDWVYRERCEQVLDLQWLFCDESEDLQLKKSEHQGLVKGYLPFRWVCRMLDQDPDRFRGQLLNHVGVQAVRQAVLAGRYA